MMLNFKIRFRDISKLTTWRGMDQLVRYMLAIIS